MAGAPSAKPPPPRVGPYEVGRRIGGGGMASVHLGRSTIAPAGTDSEAAKANEIVALKIVKSELKRDQKYVDMFRDEASILSRMSHPNIVRTLEYGVTDGHCYMAMELLLGRSLDDVFDALGVQDVALPSKLVAWIGARVAAALHYAHELVDETGAPLHVIHRDANPSNIVLTYDGDVKLIDFGLAKAARRVARTDEGVVKGKVPYLAPEQIAEEEIDNRTDIFALGASLWELVARQRLFKRETDLDTIRAIRSGTAPSLFWTAPHAPTELSEAIMKALSFDRKDRFQTAAEMQQTLDKLFGRDDAKSKREVANLIQRLYPGEAAARERWRTSLQG